MDLEVEWFQKVGVFLLGITFSLSDIHEQSGVFGDGQWAGFIIVDKGLMNDQESVGFQ